MKKVLTLEEYAKQLDPKSRAVLQQLRKLVRETAPQSSEKISYGMPAFEYKGILMYFAVWKAHYGIYPFPSAILHFEDALQKYSTSKGCIQLPKGEALPVKLIRNLLLFRLNENVIKEELKQKNKTNNIKSKNEFTEESDK